MADRTVVVEWVLRANQFKRAAKDIGEDVKDVNKQVDKLDGKKVDLDTKPAQRGLADLNADIIKSRQRVDHLKNSFRETGDIGFLRDWRKEAVNLNKLTRWAKEFGDETDKSSTAVHGLRGALGAVGTAFTKAIPATGALSNPIVASSAIAVAALATIPAGAAVAGASLAALGVGFLGLGAFAVRGSQQVQHALEALGNTAGATLSEAAAGLEGPFVHALDTARQSVRTFGPDLRVMFDSVSPSIGRATDGVVEFSEHAMPGLKRAVMESGTVLDALSATLPTLGDAVSSFGDSMADSAQGGASMLTAAMNMLAGSIGVTGEVIEQTSTAWDFFTSGAGKYVAGIATVFVEKQDQVNQALGTGAMTAREYAEAVKQGGMSSANAAEHVVELGRAAQEASPLQKSLSEKMVEVADTTNTAAERANALGEAWTLMTGGTVSAGRALLEVKEALADAKESVHGVYLELIFSGNAWNTNTEAGRAAYAAYLDVVEGAKRSALAVYENSLKTKTDAQAKEDAKAAYKTYIDNLIKTYREAGFSEEAIRRMIGAAREMPPQVQTKVSAPGATTAKKQIDDVTTAEKNMPKKTGMVVAAPGAVQAAKDVSSVTAAERRMPKKTAVNTSAPGATKAEKDIDNVAGAVRGLQGKSVNVIVTANTSSANAAERRLSGRAAGGPVGPHQSYVVGERGREILTMGSTRGYVTPNHQLPIGGPNINATARTTAPGMYQAVRDIRGLGASIAAYSTRMNNLVSGGGFGLGSNASSSVRAILAVARRFHPAAQVSSGYRPGDPGRHGQGLAADIIGGGVSGMNRIAQGFYGMSGHLLELIHSPSWFVKNGQRVGRGYYASVYNQHFNHVHVAARADALGGILGIGAGFSGGGRYQGGPMVVGENGPELQIPDSPGYVKPLGRNWDGAQMVPAQNVTVELSFRDSALIGLIDVRVNGQLQQSGRALAHGRR